MTGISAMRSDLREFLPDMTWRDKVVTWLRYYAPTKRWVDRLLTWRELRKYGPMPPIEQDRVALHLGFVDGVPACSDGPVCAAHGWSVSPINEQEG